MYQMMSNMRLLLSWNCPLVHEHSTDRLRSARLPRRRRVHFSDMGKGPTAFFLGKTNRPPASLSPGETSPKAPRSPRPIQRRERSFYF
jgi:hypothetical protein